jgi:tRNA A-37 threonylcarbamoyl transferase component Bud32
MNYNHINSVILTLISDYFGCSLDIRDISVFQFDNLKSKVNYVVKVSFNNKKFVIKYSDNVAKTNGRPLIKQHLMHEFLFLKLLNDNYARCLENLSVTIPRPIFFNDKINAILMEDIGGVSLSVINLTIQRIIILSKLLSFFHSLQLPIELSKSINNNNPIVTLSDFKFRYYKEYCTNNELTYPLQANNLIIGDFSVNNLLSCSNNVGVVDFDFISLGDQAYDIAHFLSFFYIIPFIIKESTPILAKEIVFHFASTYFSNNQTSNNKLLKNFNLYLAPLMIHRIWRYFQSNKCKNFKIHNNIIELSKNIYESPVFGVEDLYDKNFSIIERFI